MRCSPAPPVALDIAKAEIRQIDFDGYSVTFLTRSMLTPTGRRFCAGAWQRVSVSALACFSKTTRYSGITSRLAMWPEGLLRRQCAPTVRTSVAIASSIVICTASPLRRLAMRQGRAYLIGDETDGKNTREAMRARC